MASLRIAYLEKENILAESEFVSEEDASELTPNDMSEILYVTLLRAMELVKARAKEKRERYAPSKT